MTHTSEAPGEFSAVSGLQDILVSEDVKEILGKAGIEYFLNLDGRICLQNPITAGHLSSIYQVLIINYGANGARGILFRVGRTFFDDWLRYPGKEKDLLDLGRRAMPSQVRIKAGLVLLADNLVDLWGLTLGIDEDEQAWYWDMCQGEDSSSAPGCFITGVLQAYMVWAGGGKPYSVREIAGDGVTALPCRIAIDKKPIG